jgi:hypothetical protein
MSEFCHCCGATTPTRDVQGIALCAGCQSTLTQAAIALHGNPFALPRVFNSLFGESLEFDDETGEDFIVTVHCLDRMDERFPDLCSDLTDAEVGKVIQREVMEAIALGRQSKIAPAELKHLYPERWVPTKLGATFVWNEERTRGYVIMEKGESLIVLTALREYEQAA